MGTSPSNNSPQTDYIPFAGYLDNSSQPKPVQTKPIIDKEHVTLSKIFKISLEESDKFLYLELYLAQLLSLGKDPKFRLDNLDDIIISVIQSNTITNVLEYLFDTYHRSIEMIEKRFKHEYGLKYKSIHQIISNYICLILSEPQNLGLTIPKEQRYNSFKKYLENVVLDELGFLLYDLYNSTLNSHDNMKEVFSLYFKYIHEQNLLSHPNFFNRTTLTNNLDNLILLLKTCPKLCSIYLDLCCMKNYTNAKDFQAFNFLALYFIPVPHEVDINIIKQNININKSQRERDIVLQNNTNKLNEYLDKLSDLLITLYINDKHKSINWLYIYINLNIDKLKMYYDPKLYSSNGFTLNFIFVLLKIFLKHNETYSKFIFNVVSKIDPLYTLTKDKFDYNKIERTNKSIIEEVLKDQESVREMIPNTFHIYTELFFAIHILITYTLKKFQLEIHQISKVIQEKLSANQNDPVAKDLIHVQYCINMYIKNAEMLKCYIHFSEVTCFFIFALNNRKYSQHAFRQQINSKEEVINYKEYLDDFYYHVDFNDNFAISLLPENIYKNVITISLFIRNFQSDVLINNISSTKAVVYFSLIFSCNNKLLLNPHFRMEIFDIMVYFFVIERTEKGSKLHQIFQLLKEKFIKDSLMESIMRVFVDAERLGTANQFYEKFSVRNKILVLIDNINKGYGQLFVENIQAYAKKHDDESTKMVMLLMSDITYLNDEMIEKLILIKKYENLLNDKERYNAMSDENKKFELSKYQENERIVKAEISLFNNSLKFLVSISKVLQDKFMNTENKLCEKIANLLNYSLDVFVTSRGNQLKVKNLAQYEFNPRFILESIIKTYAVFADYKEFHEYIIKDERSYRFNNFLRAKGLVGIGGKVQIDIEAFERFVKLIEKLKVTEEEFKSKEISYDDAPEEFLDPITTVIMDDPVMMPKSKMIVDRVTIETHLVHDPSDPFNREPLTKEMLIPCNDLKKRIEQYKQRKQAEKQTK